MRVEPSRPRYKIRSEAGVLSVACPPRRNWLLLLFLIAWLGGWTIGATGTFTEITKPGEHQAFLTFWLVGWAVGELCVLTIVLWQLADLEELSMVHGNLIQRVSIAGIGRNREDGSAFFRASDLWIWLRSHRLRLWGEDLSRRRGSRRGRSTTNRRNAV